MLIVSKVILDYEMPEICILNIRNCLWNLMLPRLEKTDEHWSYLHYKLVKEFSARSFLPPPFNIIHRCWQIISMITQSNRCCSTSSPNKEFELSMALIVTCICQSFPQKLWDCTKRRSKFYFGQAFLYPELKLP